MPSDFRIVLIVDERTWIDIAVAERYAWYISRSHVPGVEGSVQIELKPGPLIELEALLREDTLQDAELDEQADGADGRD